METTAQFQNFNTRAGYEWAAHEAQRSSRFRAAVDELRTEARHDHPRAGGVLVQYEWAELERAPADWNDVPYDTRRDRAWMDTVGADRHGLRHVTRYTERVRKVAGTFLGGKETAARLHQLVRCEAGYLVDVSGLAAPFDGPTGLRASAAAAHIAGGAWGSGATANRQAYYNARNDTAAPSRAKRFKSHLDDSL